MAAWYYEFGGKKTGPVPSDTLRHLADHQAIQRTTNVWKDDMPSPVPAEKIRNLFPDPSSSTETARRYLTTLLEAIAEEDKDRLDGHSPPLSFFHASTISGVLIDYTIVSMIPELPPSFDPHIPIGKQTKPVRQLFHADVRATFCSRPSQPVSLAELHATQPGRREEVLHLECKEFADGDWLFFDRTLAD